MMLRHFFRCRFRPGLMSALCWGERHLALYKSGHFSNSILFSITPFAFLFWLSLVSLALLNSLDLLRFALIGDLVDGSIS